MQTRYSSNRLCSSAAMDPSVPCDGPSRLLGLLETPTYVPHVLEAILQYACPAPRSLCALVAPLCSRLREFVYSTPGLWRRLKIDVDIDVLCKLSMNPKACNVLWRLRLNCCHIKTSHSSSRCFANLLSKLTALQLTACKIYNWGLLRALASSLCTTESGTAPRATPNLQNITLNIVADLRSSPLGIDFTGKASGKALENDQFWPGLKTAVMNHSCVDVVLFVLQQSCSLEMCEMFVVPISRCVAALVERHAATLKEFRAPCIDDESIRLLANCQNLQVFAAFGGGHVTSDALSTLSVGCIGIVSLTYPGPGENSLPMIWECPLTLTGDFHGRIVDVIVRSVPTLERLLLGSVCCLTDDLLHTLVAGLPQLVNLLMRCKELAADLQLTALESVPGDNWKRLCDIQLSCSKVCNGLRHLCLTKLSIKTSCTSSDIFANRLSNLSELQLEKCQISNRDMWLSLAGATPNLQKITLSCPEFDTQEGLAGTAAEIDPFWPQLEVAIMKCCTLDLVLFVLYQSCSLKICEFLNGPNEISRCVVVLVERHANTLREFVQNLHATLRHLEFKFISPGENAAIMLLEGVPWLELTTLRVTSAFDAAEIADILARGMPRLQQLQLRILVGMTDEAFSTMVKGLPGASSSN